MFYFISFLCSVLGSIDSSGWADVAKPAKNKSFEHAGDEDVKGIWVIFSKKIGNESFKIRFPDDPKYVQHKDGSLEIFSEQNGEEYRLSVFPSSYEYLEKRAEEVMGAPGVLIVDIHRTAENILDLTYKSEGKWAQERVYLTESHLYIFQTKSDVFHGGKHEYFVSSFSL